jgi:GNAT superfamily N-acetyltransferase
LSDPDDHPIHIRPATAGDLDTLIAFNQAMSVETEQKTLDPVIAAAGVRAGYRDPDRAQYLVAEVGGKVVGQTMVTPEWSDWRNGFFWWIQSVYVEPTFRRRGVFQALYEHIRALARGQADVCGLRLYVHRDNARAIDTYRRLGMELTGYQLFEEEWPVANDPAR